MDQNCYTLEPDDKYAELKKNLYILCLFFPYFVQQADIIWVLGFILKNTFNSTKLRIPIVIAILDKHLIKTMIKR